MKGKSLFKKIAAAATTVAMLASVSVVGFATANEPENGGTPGNNITGKVYAESVAVRENDNSYTFTVTYNTDVTSNAIGYTMLAYKATVVAGYEGDGSDVVGVAQNTTASGKTFTFDVAKDDGVENATDSREVAVGDSVVILLSSDAAAGAVGYLYTLKGVADSASIEDVAVSVPYYQANDENKVKDAIAAQITEGVSVTIAKDSAEETKVVEGVTVKSVDLETPKKVTFTVPAFEQGNLSYAGGDVVANLTVNEQEVEVTALVDITDVSVTKAEVDAATGADDAAKLKAAIVAKLAKSGITFTDGASFSQLVASETKENAEVNADLASLLTVEVESVSSNDYSDTYNAMVTVEDEATIVADKVVAGAEITSNTFTVVQYTLGADKEIVELALTKSDTPATVSSAEATNDDIIAAAKAAITGVTATVTDNTGSSEEDAAEAELWKDAVDAVVADSANWTVTPNGDNAWTATLKETTVTTPGTSNAVNVVTITATVNVTVETAPAWACGDVDHSGDIGINDATALLKGIAEIDDFEYVLEEVAVSDTDGDGVVGINDATTLLKHIAEIDDFDTLPLE